MEIESLHSWEVTPREAMGIQAGLAAKVSREPPRGFAPSLVAAADISCNRFSNTLFAAVVVVTLQELDVVETRTCRVRAGFPYVPGLLSFREIPALVAAFRSLEHEPDAILMDGQGMAHPRRCGLACHAGLMLGKPTVGVAKSVLVGDFEPPPPDRGEFSPLVHGEETVGRALRTRAGVKPVFVSVGHMTDLDAACELVLRCAPKYRIPEPLREAHNAANAARREYYAARD